MIEYLKVLVWTMLFIVVIEMILPSSALQKYIKLILRFILIYTIIAPIVGILFKEDIFEITKYDEYISLYNEQFDLMTEQGIRMEDYERELQDSFELREKALIKERIEKELDISVEVMVSSIMENYTPQLTDIELTVSPKKEEKNAGDHLIMVPKIVIGNKSDSIRLYQKNIEKEIKKLLSDFYNLGQVNIYILVQDVK
ncbi:hypothetical protein AN641_02270 [Candidatus Epulonipiscioides gigas]|nr:hypothetical protein AN641_02270 [Epulopiscium sp. SCG-C07WGA-EpuloA2]